MSYDKVQNILIGIKDINHDLLPLAAEEKLVYINIEHNGRIAIKCIEEYLPAKRYLSCLNAFVSVHEEYSGYDELLSYEAEIENGILEKISKPDTIEEYEDCIEYVSKCLDILEIPVLLDRKSDLEKELTREIEIQDKIQVATSQYEKGLVRESFFTLALGLEEYPENDKVEEALVNLRNDYIISTRNHVVELCEKEEYKEALQIVEEALEVYECEDFLILCESVKEQKSFLYRAKNDVVRVLQSVSAGWTAEELDVKQAAENTSAYVMKSGKKLFLGDYSEENVTLLTIGGNLVASVAGVDLLFDLRDLSYDVTHWGEDDYYVVRLATDVVALIPVIGAVKYFEHVKTAANLADNITDTVKTSDMASGVADVVSDSAKNSNKISNIIDSASEASKRISKAANSVDTSKDAKEIVEGIAEGYVLKKTIKSDLAGEVHDVTGVGYKLKKLDYTDGTKIMGVYPEFPSFSDVQLSNTLYKASESEHKKYCMEELAKQVKPRWSKIRKNFTEEELEDIANGNIPERFVWHHNEEEGLMQLVDKKIHQNTPHTGGMSQWGRGYN